MRQEADWTEALARLTDYDAVQIWLKNVHLQSPGSTNTDHERLKTLLAFCSFVEKGPDTIISECFRTRNEGDEWKRIKFKVRSKYSDLIKQAQEDLFGGGVVGQRYGNMIRSFFIHNGVFMQAEPLIR